MQKKQNILRIRRLFGLIILVVVSILVILVNPDFWKNTKKSDQNSKNYSNSLKDLNSLEVKGRAPKTDYSRD